MPHRNEAVKAAALTAAAEYKADIYLYSGPIDDGGRGALIQEISGAKHHKAALLILTTHGGRANPAYQIARLFQNTYEEFALFTPCFCQSAGTIIALGANKLIMDQFSELGPLDVQLLKENEIAARKSGLLSRSSFEALSDAAFELYEAFMLRITMQSGGRVNFRLASELSATLTSNLLAPIYGQINPDTVGSDYRDLNIAFEYGSRLVQHSGNATPEAVQRLVQGYPSHDFIIDSDEAKELFRTVETPSVSLYTLVGAIAPIAYQEQSQRFVKALTLKEWFLGKATDNETERAEGTSPEAAVDDGGARDRQGDPGAQRPTPTEERVTRLPTAAAGE
jgi:hypothetical protein